MEYYKNLSLEDLPNEVWKDVEGYEGLYKVSNLGRVKSIARTVRKSRGFYSRTDKILKPILNNHNYLQVGLCNGRKKTCVRNIHRLVLKSFVKNPNPGKYYECDHINTITTDNRAENLRWCDRKLNMQNELTVIHRKNALQKYCNEESYVKKQRENQPHKMSVLQYTIDGVLLREYISLSDASRKTGANISAISRCCKGKQKTSLGFVWKFK